MSGPVPVGFVPGPRRSASLPVGFVPTPASSTVQQSTGGLGEPPLIQQAVTGGLNALPVTLGTLGGIGGALIPVPGGPALGAGLGAYTGEALRQVGMGQKIDPYRLIEQGGLYALLQHGGDVAAGQMANLGKPLMNFAVKPSARVAQRFAGSGRNVFSDLLAAGRPVSRAADATVGPLAAQLAQETTAARGAQQAGVLAQRDAALKAFQEQVAGERATATQASKALIAGADESGKRYTAAQLAQGVLAGEAQRVGRPLNRNEQLAVVATVRNYANDVLGPRIEGVGTKARTLFTPSEVDKVRQFARDAEKGRLNAIQSGSAPPPGIPIETDIHNTARELLHNDIPGLQQARALESSKIRLNKVAAGGSARRIAMTGQRGEPSAQAFTTSQRAAAVKAMRDRAALAAAPMGETERQLLMAQALSGAANRHISPWLHLGLPGVAGGVAGSTEFAHSHNPVEAGAAGLTAALLAAGAMSPRFTSRAGLLTQSPILEALLRRLPIQAGPLFMPPPPDSTNQGGY